VFKQLLAELRRAAFTAAVAATQSSISKSRFIGEQEHQQRRRLAAGMLPVKTWCMLQPTEDQVARGQQHLLAGKEQQ